MVGKEILAVACGLVAGEVFFPLSVPGNSAVFRSIPQSSAELRRTTSAALRHQTDIGTHTPSEKPPAAAVLPTGLLFLSFASAQFDKAAAAAAAEKQIKTTKKNFWIC